MNKQESEDQGASEEVKAKEKAQILEDFRTSASELVAIVHPIFLAHGHDEESFTIDGESGDTKYGIFDMENAAGQLVYVMTRLEHDPYDMTIYAFFVTNPGNQAEGKPPTVRLDKEHLQKQPEPKAKSPEHPFTKDDVIFLRSAVSGIKI